MSIAENIAQIRERIGSAAHRAGRDPETVTLMAVSKTFPAEAIRDAYDAGENRVQEFAGKAENLRGLTDARWHMIGHLQTNKTAKAAELFQAIDSVDSLKLAERLNDGARSHSKKLAVLIEINVDGETAKSGVLASSPELENILTSAARLEFLEIRGLMTIPPYTEDPQSARPHFRKLCKLRDEIAARNLPAVSMTTLSMGMSHDFEVAIEEGSTCVRVGTAIFGARAKP